MDFVRPYSSSVFVVCIIIGFEEEECAELPLKELVLGYPLESEFDLAELWFRAP